MAATLTDLLGEQLLQHNEPNQVSTSHLDGKTVALYFSSVHSLFHFQHNIDLFPGLTGVHLVDNSHRNWLSSSRRFRVKCKTKWTLSLSRGIRIKKGSMNISRKCHGKHCLSLVCVSHEEPKKRKEKKRKLM